jgi:hypothetical protein
VDSVDLRWPGTNGANYNKVLSYALKKISRLRGNKIGQTLLAFQ